MRSLDRLPLEPGQRIYSLGDIPALGLQSNLSQIWKVPDLGGYTPLQLRDMHVFLQKGENGRLLDPTAPTLDVAAVRYVVLPEQIDDVLRLPNQFAPETLDVFLSKAQAEGPRVAAFGLQRPRHATQIALVSALGLSVDVPQNHAVADVVVHDVLGHTQTFSLRAGQDTAEIAYDRPGFAARVRHRRASVFTRAGGATWYETARAVLLPGRIAGVVIRLTDPGVALNVRNISLIDQSSGFAYPLSAGSPFRSDSRRFHELVNVAHTSIFENRHAQPAAWIAAHVIAVSPTHDDVDLATLRERLRQVDVKSTAFVSGLTDSPESLSGGDAIVRRVQPERRVIDTVCQLPCLLLSSERWTPGWPVTIDGQPSPLLRADGLLQAVVVPAGRHAVTLRYRWQALRKGGRASVAAFVLSCLWLGLRRTRKPAFGSPGQDSPP